MNAKDTINKLIDSAIEVGLTDEDIAVSFYLLAPQEKIFQPCPGCGHDTGFKINRRAYGWWREYYDSCGNYQELDGDRVGAADSSIIRCDTCDVVRTDVFYHDGKILPW